MTPRSDSAGGNVPHLPWLALQGFAATAQMANFNQAYALFQAGMGLFGSPEFHLGAIELDGEVIPVTDSVVAETPFCRLRRFSTPGRRDRRVLLCAPLAGHRAVVLRETVASLVAVADVYVTDWIDARDVPCSAGRFGLDDYVLMLQHFMTLLEPAALDVVAVCQATVPALAAAARLAAGDASGEVRALVLMGGPIDARLQPTMLGRIAATLSEPTFLATSTGAVPVPYPGAGRHVYPGFLQLPTLASGQPDRMVALMQAIQPPWLQAWARGPADQTPSQAGALSYAAMMDMPAEYLLDTIHIVFQQFLLPRGEWVVQGEPIRPAAMTSGRLMTVEGDRDNITGAGQTHAAQGLCSGLRDGRRTELTVPGCDHYGLFSGDVWRAEVFPRLREWLEAP